MRRLVRLTVLACVGAFALAFAGSALAAYTPTYSVNTPGTLGGAGTTTLNIKFAQGDQATARIVLYVPTGYVGTYNQAAGTQIGTVSATVLATQLGPSVSLPLTGTINVVPQSQVAATATACTGTATHTAYWVFTLSAANQPPLNVPVFLDVTAGAETALGAAKLTTCLTSPAATSFGAKPTEIHASFNNVWTNPSSAGQFVWDGIFTPYTADNGVPSPAGTVEARAIVGTPTRLGIRAKNVSKKKVKFVKKNGKKRKVTTVQRRVLVSGSLSEGGQPVGSQSIVLLLGRSPGALKASFTTTTNDAGAFGGTIALKKPGRYYFQVRATVPDRDATAAGCAQPNPAVPGGCVSATLSGFTAVSARVSVKV
jgi:hypothetical protein